MPTLLDYYRYGVLAQASYVNVPAVGLGADAGTPLVNAANFVIRANEDAEFPGGYIRNTLPSALGNAWFGGKGTETWSLLNQDTWDGARSGFSGTLFGNGTQKVLAIRGTEGGGPSDQQTKDLMETDLGDIGFNGLALHQAVDMINYILRLIAPKAQTDVAQLTLVQNQSNRPADIRIPYISTRNGYCWLDMTHTGQGLGQIAPGEQIVVAGHSLGGHLAALATRLFPWLVSDAYTYNAPGFDPTTANVLGTIATLVATTGPLGIAVGAAAVTYMNMKAEQLTDEYIDLVGQTGAIPTPADGFAAVASKIHAMVSEDIVPGDDASVVSSTLITGIQPSARQGLAVERDSHDMGQINDSLRLHALLASLNQSLSFDDIKTLYLAASATVGDTHEKMVEALYNVFLGAAGTPGKHLAVTEAPGLAGKWSDSGDFTARSELHDAMTKIEDALKDKTGLTLVSLIGKSAADLQSAASNPDALATRYALKELNPFAIIGDNSLYDKFNTGAKDHDLDLYSTDTGKGLSPQWLEDRAKLLAAVIIANTSDSRSGSTLIINPTGSDTVLFKDMISNITLRDGQTTLEPRRITFGSEFGDSLRGGNQADHLYGGAGADTLIGNAGDDYLEGGTGNDTLRGGAGLDTYRIDKNSGTDTLIDAAGSDGDGLGSILYNGTTLSGTLTQDATTRNLYHHATRPELLIRYIGAVGARGDLVIIDPTVGGSKIILQNWGSGELGLSLAGSPAATPSRTTIDGDLNYTEFTATLSPGAVYGAAWRNVRIVGTTYQYDPDGTITGVISEDVTYNQVDALGNLIGSLGGPVRDDGLLGSANGDLMRGHAGNDVLFGGNGEDRIESGTGDDRSLGGNGDDRIIGDAGSDILVGEADDDTLIAGDEVAPEQFYALGESQSATGNRGDFLDGGSGDDTLVGEGGNDVLLGGEGSDVLFGGAGDDLVLSSRTGSHAQADWQVSVNRDPSTQRVLSWTYQNAGELPGLALTAPDQAEALYGGAGNDVIESGGGNDYLDGGSGNDLLLGNDGADYLDGADGKDDIVGGGGGDELFGGAGDDEIAGDGSPLLLAGQGADYLDGEAGNDKLWGDGGSDELFGGTGNDDLVGDAADIDAQYHGNDYLDGEEGDDRLWGNAGADTLIGGAGNDILRGGAGRDTYIFNKGDGVDQIYDDDSGPEKSLLIFGAGVDPASIKLRKGSLLLDLGDGDAIHIENFDAENPLATQSFDAFQFADGSSLTWNELIARGFDLDGTDNDDTIIGTSVVDRIDGRGGNDLIDGLDGIDLLDGGAGNDSLAGGDGADTLTGGTGSDVLDGGLGDDTYILNRGDGEDRIIDRDGSNTLQFGPGIALADLELGIAREPDGTAALAIRYGATDRVSLLGAPNDLILGGAPDGHLAGLRFDDGSTLDLATLFAGAAKPALQINGGPDDELLDGGFAADVLGGGAGNDRIYAWAGDDILLGGPGFNTLAGGPGNDSYVLGTGGIDEIDDRNEVGDETLRLAPGLHFADLLATRAGDDLTIDAPDEAGTAILKGFFAAQVEGKDWILAGDLDVPQALAEWAAERLAEQDREETSGALKIGFESALRIDLARRGMASESLDGWQRLQDGNGDGVMDWDPAKYLPLSYTFGGVDSLAVATSGGLLRLASSQVDEVSLSTETRIRVIVNPVFELQGAAGASYVLFSSGAVRVPSGWRKLRLDDWRVLVYLPDTYHQVKIGETRFNKTIAINTELLTRSFTLQQVTGSAGADRIEMAAGTATAAGTPVVFRGSVMAGAGDDEIDLGTSGGYANDWFEGDEFWGNNPQGLGAFVDGGEGDDRIVGTDGNDLLLDGAGDDFMDGGGSDNDFLWGGGGSDALIGGAGRDQLSGDFNSILREDNGFVASGDDYLEGGEGDDIMTGGSEDDNLYGDGAQGNLVVSAGCEGLVGWTPQAFHGEDRRLRIANKSRRWRHGDSETTASNDGTWRNAA